MKRIYRIREIHRPGEDVRFCPEWAWSGILGIRVIGEDGIFERELFPVETSSRRKDRITGEQWRIAYRKWEESNAERTALIMEGKMPLGILPSYPMHPVFVEPDHNTFESAVMAIQTAIWDWAHEIKAQRRSKVHRIPPWEVQ